MGSPTQPSRPDRTGPVPQGPSRAAPPGGSAGGPPPTGYPSDRHPAASVPHGQEQENQAESAVDEDLDELGRLALERDEYRELAQRIQADFENYKKRALKLQTEHLERAAQALVVKLLPVLDTFDLALAHGAEELRPVHRAMTSGHEAEGLERLDPQGKPFDPNEHDAVAHEPAEGEGAPPVVLEVMRPGYRWKGRVLRPAMVKVRG